MKCGHQGVAGLVIGGDQFFLLGDDHAAPFRAHHHAVLGLLELGVADRFLVAAGGQQGGLVDQVGQVGAREAGRALGDAGQVDVARPA